VDSAAIAAVDVAAALDARQYLTAFNRLVDIAPGPDTPVTLFDRRAAKFVVALADAQNDEAVASATRDFLHQEHGFAAKRLRPLPDDSVLARLDSDASGTAPDPCPRTGVLAAIGGCRRYVTINSYLGAAVSTEFPYGSAGGQRRVQAAYYLPVGLEIGLRPPPLRPGHSSSTTSPDPGGTSVGLFFQALDLGSLAAMRVTSHTASSQPTSVEQLVSPGLFLTWSYGPKYWSGLLGVSVARAAQRAADGHGVSAWRVTFVPVSVDVPLLAAPW